MLEKDIKLTGHYGLWDLDSSVAVRYDENFENLHILRNQEFKDDIILVDDDTNVILDDIQVDANTLATKLCNDTPEYKLVIQNWTKVKKYQKLLSVAIANVKERSSLSTDDFLICNGVDNALHLYKIHNILKVLNKEVFDEVDYNSNYKHTVYFYEDGVKVFSLYTESDFESECASLFV